MSLHEDPPNAEHPSSADVAAYALRALEPAEADALRRHLETCAVCSDELRAFQRIADDLGTAVLQVSAPPEIRRQVMRTVEQEAALRAAAGERRPAGARARRRDAVLRGRSWLRGPTIALVSGMAFALAAFIVVVIAFPGRQNGRTVSAATTLGGTAALHISAERTELVVRHIAAPPRGKIYEVWLQYGKGRPRPNALFGVDRSGDASVAVSGSMYGVSHVMVTTEPAPHGTSTPTSAAVITASLS
ncbi:MAG TPA: anti-sigma factor [Solirubrobacteraceae bacterium]|nr:anti-sigma factor [Solirubrobacteraceae bacterium]